MSGVCFFVVAYCVLGYVFLNCFLAILLETFETTDDEKDSIQMAGFKVKVLRVLQRAQSRMMKHVQQAQRKTLEVGSIADGADSEDDAEQEANIASMDMLQEVSKASEVSQIQAPDVKLLFFFEPPTPNLKQPTAPWNLRMYVKVFRENKW